MLFCGKLTIKKRNKAIVIITIKIFHVTQMIHNMYDQEKKTNW